ncbi:MAG: hypothetical protein GX410_09000 [Elusimicrobia bacterium]|nr:hypothetical protein [Elusimicrobiota bacterium]
MRGNKGTSRRASPAARRAAPASGAGLRRLRTPFAQRRAKKIPAASWPVMAALFVALAWPAAYLVFQYRELHTSGIVLKPDAPVFYSDQFITFTLAARNPVTRAKLVREGLPPVYILRDGQPVATIGGLRAARVSYDPVEQVWRGRFPCPWKPHPGEYSFSVPFKGKLADEFHADTFTIGRRSQAPVKKGFVALTLEYAGWHGALKLRTPDGQPSDWRAIPQWARYLGADAVWVLAGRSSFAGGRTWDPVDTATLKKLGAECHRNGLQFGVWVMSYMTQPMGADKSSRYKWSWSSEQGGLMETKGISLSDPQRPADIAAFLAPFSRMPEVDFLGLDYIRNAIGGYEMADDFYRDMDWVSKPKGWETLDAKGRARAFAAMKIFGKDKDLVDAWQWWRAHKAAGVVRFVRGRLGGGKTYWAFTLGWEKGWQHGQDPVMMRDAGIDADAVMLYEADKGQYASMMKDWGAYLDKGDLQLLAGDIVDTPLHQGGGSAEYKRRLEWAASDIYGGAPADGLFIHDLMRLLRGRLAPENTQSWAQAVRQTVESYKAMVGGRKSSAPARGALLQPTE